MGKVQKEYKYSPESFTFKDFENVIEKTFENWPNIQYAYGTKEDSVPWCEIGGVKVIKPEEALKMMEALQSNIIDEVYFNSLQGKELRLVVNGKFHMSKKDLEYGFDDDYASDFGMTIKEMKKEYDLK